MKVPRKLNSVPLSREYAYLGSKARKPYGPSIENLKIRYEAKAIIPEIIEAARRQAFRVFPPRLSVYSMSKVKPAKAYPRPTVNAYRDADRLTILVAKSRYKRHCSGSSKSAC